MKYLTVFALAAGLLTGASSLLAEEPTSPDSTTEQVRPVKTKKSVLPDATRDSDAPDAPNADRDIKPDSEKKSPFSPSTLMRIRAQKPVEDTPPAAVVQLAPVTRIKPMLEGVLVKNDSVLASFRVGNKSIVLVPRNSLVVDDVKYVFVGYADEVATLRDEDGHNYDLRVVQHASTSSPRATDAGANLK